MTTKSPLDLIDLIATDFVFSQRCLLLPKEFGEEAKRRGVPLDCGQLDALHRVGALVPMYRVARDMRAVRRQMQEGGGMAHPLETPAAQVLGSLHEDRDAGRVFDPRAEPYRPWHNYMRVMGSYPPMPGQTKGMPLKLSSSEFLYSPDQLLLLADLAPLVGCMTRRRVGNDWRYNVPKADAWYYQQFAQRGASNTHLAITLSALEAHYLPDIVAELTGPSETWFATWTAYQSAFDPVAMLGWLNWTPQEVYGCAERLLMAARRMDPLEEWLELVKQVDPHQRNKLRREALLAYEHRVAAEILLQFYEDLTAAGAAPPIPTVDQRSWHPLDERLRTSRKHLDGVLLDYGLSPYPAVVLVLEGETEYEIIVPRVMDVLGLPRSRRTIHLENARTIQRDLEMLVSYAITPVLGEKRGQSVMSVDRRLTRFLVAVDPEKDYKTPEGREKKRKSWVRRIERAMPKEHRTPAVDAQIDRLVHVETWGNFPFEYAHFSDEEIAQAILNLHGRSRPGTSLPHITPAKIASLRARGENLETLLKGSGISKVQLAEELWPILETQLENAKKTGTLDTIPVARVVHKAWELAQMALRQRAIEL